MYFKMKRIDKDECNLILFQYNLKLENENEYRIASTKTTFLTKEGYKIFTCLTQIKMGHICSYFSPKNPYAIENMKLWMLNGSPEYELLSELYKSSNDKLTFRLKNSNLPTFETTWSNFYSNGTRHPAFHYEKISKSERFDYETVREKYNFYLKDTDWKLKENEEYKYINSHTKLIVSDSEGYLSEVKLNGLSQGKKPRRFFKGLEKTSTYNMNRYLENNTNYTLKDGQVYQGNDFEYAFICAKHGEFKTKWVIIQNGHQCMECYLDNNRGENNINWNPNLTDEDRLYLRKIDGYGKWRKEVYHRDRYTCRSCNKRSDGNLNAHHLDSYDWCLEKRVDVENGITLCILCHTAFHDKYGYGNNTKYQYEEWIKSRGDIEKIKSYVIVQKWKRKTIPIESKNSGVKGITWEKEIKKWRIRFKKNGLNYSGGYFENLDDAINKKQDMLNNIK